MQVSFFDFHPWWFNSCCKLFDPLSEDRKKDLTKWWTEKETLSWKAWLIKATIDSWEGEDVMFVDPVDKYP
jgi:hypothetical protein